MMALSGCVESWARSTLGIIGEIAARFPMLAILALGINI